jgi:hypothetical protein
MDLTWSNAKTYWLSCEIEDISQHNIEHEKEYDFMIALMNERNKHLPNL